MEADMTMCAAVLQLLCDGFGKDDPVSRRDACWHCVVRWRAMTGLSKDLLRSFCWTSFTFRIALPAKKCFSPFSITERLN
jgi:hypothetical protein